MYITKAPDLSPSFPFLASSSPLGNQFHQFLVYPSCVPSVQHFFFLTQKFTCYRTSFAPCFFSLAYILEITPRQFLEHLPMFSGAQCGSLHCMMDHTQHLCLDIYVFHCCTITDDATKIILICTPFSHWSCRQLIFRVNS